MPFFWNLFRAHANWSALRGSETLLRLTAQPSHVTKTETETDTETVTGTETVTDNVETMEVQRKGEGDGEEGGKTFSDEAEKLELVSHITMIPSQDLEDLANPEQFHDLPLNDSRLDSISKVFDLDLNEVKRWRDEK